MHGIKVLDVVVLCFQDDRNMLSNLKLNGLFVDSATFTNCSIEMKLVLDKSKNSWFWVWIKKN